MAIKTSEEYLKSLEGRDLKIYMFGELIQEPVNHPIIRPSVNSVAMTYELANKDDFKDLMTTTSHLTGESINRYNHIHQSTKDLVKKVKMLRTLGQATCSCFQRCVGMDAMNAVYSVTGRRNRLP
jgi:4-hydroxybutyryl-CoA dehydratase/vinylacetyl-CoA-Delta-isomerase